jgi:actin-related protein 8
MYLFLEPQEIITLPKEKDPESTVWSGAAIMSGLETAIELWITQAEWNTYGSKLLREKSLCVF